MPRWGVDRHRRGVTARRNRKGSPVNLQELLDKQDFYDAPDVVAGPSAARVRSVAARRAVRVSPDSCLRIASLTKAFTCTALVKTMRDNSISLDTSVIELLPDLAPDWRADVRLTVEQKLGQVSELRQSVDSTALAPLGDGPHALQEAARLVVGTGNEHEPGTRWSYYNGNYILAGAVLAALSCSAIRVRAAPAEACGRPSPASWPWAKGCSPIGPFWTTSAGPAPRRTIPWSTVSDGRSALQARCNSTDGCRAIAQRCF
ncbi:beta-lactamase family protein [Streptomyces mirabilis]|nr:beta-lactamase family protein [Streptomyces mirabilis]